MKQISIYTDGCCLKNPGPGGIGYIILINNTIKKYNLGYYYTTNNRMELMSIIMALKTLGKNKYIINLFTDSKYLFLGINNWLKIWINNNWKNSKKKKIKNYDLWVKINKLKNNHILICNWIKAHNNNDKNDNCDKLAKLAALNPSKKDKLYNNI